MKEIVKVLLQEGIDEDTIHKVLDLIEEEYDVINEVTVGKWSSTASNILPKREKDVEIAQKVHDIAKNNASSVNNHIKDDRKLTKSGKPRKKFSMDNDVDWDSYNNAQKTAQNAEKSLAKAKKKLQHAKDVNDLNLNKDSKVSTKKLIQASRNSKSDRSANYRRSSSDSAKERFHKTMDIEKADPTKKINAQKELNAKKSAREEVNRELKKQEEVAKANRNPVYQQDEFTEKAKSLENIYRDRKATEKAGTEQANAQINQGLRNKFERIYKNEGCNMKEIVKVLLQEGIDEDMINRVLDLIEEEYEVISELDTETIRKTHAARVKNHLDSTAQLRDNPNKENLKNYEKNSGKLERNFNLTSKALARKGPAYKDLAQRLSREGREEATKTLKNNYERANQKLKDIADGPASLDDKMDLKSKVQTARKNYHDAMDHLNTVPRTPSNGNQYMQTHFQYQAKHPYDTYGSLLKK